MHNPLEGTGGGQPNPIPQIGAVVLDTAHDRVGVVADLDGPVLHIRPPEGGKPWLTQQADVQPASPTDQLQAEIAKINARRGWGR
jgi:hypothetical protein